MLSFSEFESMYESYGFVFEASEAEIPKPTQPQNVLLDPKTGEPKGGTQAIFDIFKELGGEEPIKEATKGKTTSTLRVAKIGEQSQRVKSIQKMLGIKETGTFDNATAVAVKKFQKDNNLTADGKVGVQTFGKMLELEQAKEKGGISKEDAEKMMQEFERIAKTISGEIWKDPNFYLIFESGTVITVKGVQYVILVPKKDAKAKIENLKSKNMIASGFEWLAKAGEAVGQALVYTTTGVTLLTLGAVNAMITGAASGIKYLASGVISVAGTVIDAMAQAGKWVAKTISSGAQSMYETVRTGGPVLYNGFCTACAELYRGLKSGAEGLIAFTGLIARGGYKILETTTKVIFGIGSAIGITLWKAGETITNYAKQGAEWVKRKGAPVVQKMKDTIKAGQDVVVDLIKKGGDIIKAGYEKVKDFGQKTYTAVENTLSSGAKFIGDAFMKGWNYADSFFESRDFSVWENEYELTYNISFRQDNDYNDYNNITLD
jgi:hypothetical protein